VTRAERLSKLRGLYGIVDDGLEFQLAPLAWAVALAEGGASVIQLRFKRSTAREALRQARLIREKFPDILLLVNDRVDLALLCDADGVHLGEEDLPIAEARRRLGSDRLVGATARSGEQGLARLAEGADHLGIGPIFLSATKPGKTRPLGLDGLRRARALLPNTPLVAISGIDERTIVQVAGEGASAAAVIGAIGRAPDPLEATRRLRRAFASSSKP
jgi:thiamine-phosphate diphosphorylase